ncbi:MAG: hypothetical protein ACRD3Q_18760 [Terriglobales bacterium]
MFDDSPARTVPPLLTPVQDRADRRNCQALDDEWIGRADKRSRRQPAGAMAGVASHSSRMASRIGEDPNLRPKSWPDAQRAGADHGRSRKKLHKRRNGAEIGIV